jgi:hypothetical protein
VNASKVFPINACTSREVLSRILPDHETWGHSLDGVEQGPCDMLVINCSCNCRRVLTVGDIAAIFHVRSDLLFARLRALGQLDRPKS